MAADTANNEKIVQRALEAFEAAHERAMREDLAPDFVSHSMPPGFAEDADGWVQLAQHLKTGTPDGKLTILRAWVMRAGESGNSPKDARQTGSSARAAMPVIVVFCARPGWAGGVTQEWGSATELPPRRDVELRVQAPSR
jgi:hypothetical protein